MARNLIRSGQSSPQLHFWRIIKRKFDLHLKPVFADEVIMFRRLKARLSSLPCWLLLLIALLFPSPLLASSQFAGVYTGTFTGNLNCAAGPLAIIVNNEGLATLLVYDSINLGEGVFENFPINPDGTFFTAEPAPGTTTLNGTLTTTDFSGTFSDPECSGVFSGIKEPSTGPLESHGGYYKGTFSGTVTSGEVPVGPISGLLFAIIDANGKSFVVTTQQLSPGELSGSGGFVTTDVGGNIAGTLLDNTDISGTLNTINHTASGTFFQDAGGFIASGTWSMSRQFALPSSSRDDVLVDFGTGTGGLWAYLNDSTWKQLHALGVGVLATGDIDESGKDDVVVVFPGFGTWVYIDNDHWEQVHAFDAEAAVIGDLNDQLGEDIILDFGPGIGIWV
ncbi:MAG: hypothetical protein JSU88_07510, partial [Nitrospinaceae bacterium]